MWPLLYLCAPLTKDSHKCTSSVSKTMYESTCRAFKVMTMCQVARIEEIWIVNGLIIFVQDRKAAVRLQNWFDSSRIQARVVLEAETENDQIINLLDQENVCPAHTLLTMHVDVQERAVAGTAALGSF